MLVFVTEDGHLSRSDTWFIDGTFDTAPVSFFEKLYVIRAPLGESAVRCVYAFFTGKSHQMYGELVTAIADKRQELGVDMDPITVFMVFMRLTFGPHVTNR